MRIHTQMQQDHTVPTKSVAHVSYRPAFSCASFDADDEFMIKNLIIPSMRFVAPNLAWHLNLPTDDTDDTDARARRTSVDAFYPRYPQNPWFRPVFSG